MDKAILQYWITNMETQINNYQLLGEVGKDPEELFCFPCTNAIKLNGGEQPGMCNMCYFPYLFGTRCFEFPYPDLSVVTRLIILPQWVNQLKQELETL